MTTYAIELKQSHRFDPDGGQITHVDFEFGDLRLMLKLSDAERMRLVELIAGARSTMTARVTGMGTLNIKTDGAKFVYVDPQVLKAREISE